MIGLPYPNIKSPELVKKMEYINKTQVEYAIYLTLMILLSSILSLKSRAPDGKLPGQVHYENLCMKAVNQSINQSIGDEAA